ncbi:hypothetical protein EYC80_004661 [Monilinia laxa]|uniref:Uncharacterized protein n=1 Tax=Monilinia laxa TaxID=61186 RepID=A0A5N6KHF3_MONLA|nr:hypothetical protein EYC80_004661 [Monilinia laxa]
MQVQSLDLSIEVVMQYYPCIIKALTINPLLNSNWQDEDAGFEAIPKILPELDLLFTPKTSPESDVLFISPGRRMMAISSGKEIELRGERRWFSTRERLCFNYVAPELVYELTGKYSWKYNRTSGVYILMKKRGPPSQLFAILNLDMCFPSREPSKIRIINMRTPFSSVGHATKRTADQKWLIASEELHKFILLSSLEILRCEENKISKYQKSNKAGEKRAKAGVQTKVMMDGRYQFHSWKRYWAKLNTVSKLKSKLKDMFRL